MFLKAEYELHVVLHHAIRFIRLSKSSPRTAYFGRRIRDLVPEHGREPFESSLSALHRNVRVKWDYLVLSKASPRSAYVADNNSKTAARHQHSHTLSPDLVNFIEEAFVIMDVTQLTAFIHVLNQIEIWGGSDDEVDAFILDI